MTANSNPFNLPYHPDGTCVSAKDLDGHTSIFGWRFSESSYTLGGQTFTSPLVTLYVEDDENWHAKMTVSRAWLWDLNDAVQAMSAQDIRTAQVGK